MNIRDYFSQKDIEKGQMLYNEKKVILINEESTTVEALVHDYKFYRVLIEFEEDYNLKTINISHNGYSQIDPYTSPYAAAVLYKLFRNNKYNVRFNCINHIASLIGSSPSETLFSENIVHSKCYHKVVNNLVRHILRMQNYTTDATINFFSQSLDELFEYIDSLKEEPKEQLIAIQSFMHIYLHLKTNFEISADIHYAIIDECNFRIYEIITGNPFMRSYYQMIILKDQKILPYICDYNKVAQSTH